MIERARIDFYRNLYRLGRSVDLVGELGIPIAEAVRGVGEPAEIAIGTSAQGFLGYRGLVLERLQFGDLVQQTGEIAVLRPGDFGAVIHVGMCARTKSERRSKHENQKKPPNPHPTPRRNADSQRLSQGGLLTRQIDLRSAAPLN